AEQLLGPGVPRLELGVRDRPRRRDAVLVHRLAEVALAEAEHRAAVELRVAPDEVVLARPKALAAAGVPGLVAAVAQVAEHRHRVPVLRLARPHPAALEDPHAGAAAGELVGDSAAA